MVLNPEKLGASWGTVATFGRSVFLLGNEKAQRVLQSITCGTDVVNIDVSFNVLYYKGGKILNIV